MISTKLVGLIVTILSFLVALSFSAGAVIFHDYLPLIFSSLGYRGVILLDQNIPFALIQLCCFVIGIYFLLVCILERFLSFTLIKASFLGAIPWIVFISLFFFFPRGNFFASVVTLLFFITILISIVLIFIGISAGRTASSIKLSGIIVGGIFLFIGGTFGVNKLINSHILLSSFPHNENYSSRLAWTNKFFSENQSILQGVNRQLEKHKISINDNLAFLDNRTHTVVVNWMDWPFASASFEASDGKIIEICRGDKLECRLATGKDLIN